MTTSSLSIQLPPTLVEQIVSAVSELVLQRLGEDAASDSRSPWMTADQAADHLGWPKARIYKLTSVGAIPCRKHEGRLLFHRSELDRWLESFREGPRV
jgi:excisionase family DNA binding protein